MHSHTIEQQHVVNLSEASWKHALRHLTGLVIMLAVCPFFLSSCSLLGSNSSEGSSQGQPAVGQKSDINEKISPGELVQSVFAGEGIPDFSTLPKNKGHQTEVIDIITFNHKNLVLSADRSGKILLWSPREAGPRLALQVPGGIDNFAFSESKGLIAVSKGPHLLLYSLHRKQAVRELKPLKTRAGSLDFDPSGTSLLIGGADGTVYRWRFVDELTLDTQDKRERCFERYVGHATVVSKVMNHPIGRVFFSSDWQGSLNAWLPYDADPFGGEYDENLFGSRGYTDKTTRIKGLRTDAVSIGTFALSNDGQRLLVGLQDGSIEWWRVRGFTQVAKLPTVLKGAIFKVTLSPSGNLLALVGRAGVVRIFSLSEIKTVGTSVTEYHIDPVQDVPVPGAITLSFISENTLWAGQSDGKITPIPVIVPAAPKE